MNALPADLPAAAPDVSCPELGPDTVILFFGNDWFAENRTSSHQLARQLARRFRVLYFECPGWRAPRGSGRDLKKILVKLWRFASGARTVDHGIRLKTLVQIPFHRFALVRWMNRRLVRATVRWRMWCEGAHDAVTWFHVPHVPFLVGQLGERVAVYYCTDDYAAFPGVDPGAVRAMDEETTARADMVFVTSETLIRTKRERNPRTHVSPHGVEFEHFARAQDPNLPVPEDIRDLRGPVVGFFGLIEQFIDLDLIDWLAGERPEWHFVLIGRVAHSTLPRRANVHFFGRRPYESLPGYAKRFDACVILYRAGDWSFHANPIKLREYLAAGKPVVATATPQSEKFADVIEVAHSQSEFLFALDRVLAEPPIKEVISRRMQRVADSSWEARTNEVVKQIHAVLTAKALQARQTGPHLQAR